MAGAGRGVVAGRAAGWGGPIGGLRFDWAVTLLNVFLAGGLFLDTWAHVHVPGLESFFTPWHAVPYAGFGLVSAALVGAILVNRLRGGREWRDAVPAGYGYSLLGVPLFMIGGAGDLLWHTFLGIEVGVETALSPTHLVLALSILLFFVGLFRAARERDTPGGAALLPAVVSLSLFLAILSSFTDYANPFTSTLLAGPLDPATAFGPEEGEGAEEIGQLLIALGIAGVLVQSALLMGVVLTMVRRWRALPPGSMVFVVALPIAAIAVSYGAELVLGTLPMIAVGVLAGLAGEFLYRLLRPSPERVGALRAFAFAMPAATYAVYVGGVALLVGTWWSVHVWTGTIVLAGVVGLLVGLLVAPADAPKAGGRGPATRDAVREGVAREDVGGGA